jgi:hypothetical protein
MNWKLVLPLTLLLASTTVAFAGKGKGGGTRGGGQTSGDDDSGSRRGDRDAGDNQRGGGADRDGSGGQGRGGVEASPTGSFTISASSLSIPDPTRIQSRNSGAPYRVGFNMIRKVPGSALSGAQAVLDDIVEVGGQGIRQIQDGDLTWFSVTNQRGNNYTFAASDTWLQNSQGLYAIPTLFQIGPATAARNWNKSCPDEGASESEYCREPYTPGGDVLNIGNRSVKKAAETYLEHVATHYKGSDLRHFEIMNEPARYRHFDLAFFYLYRYAPGDYAELLKLASKTIKGVIPNARIVAGGMVYYDNQSTDGRDEMWEDYLDKALRAGADKYIDVFNFHYYGRWQGLEDHIGEVKTIMRRHGVGNKPIWMTEVGSSATSKSPEEQAADVFRFLSVAFGNGVELANWHTHVSSHDGRNNWGGFGTRAAGGRKNLSWYSYKLFASYLGNFGECTPLRQGKGNVWAYRYSGSHYSSQGGSERAYVIWASKNGSSIDLGGDIPGGWGQVEIIDVVPNSNGNFSVTTQAANASISVGTTPVLVVKH